jgi:DNA-binding NtrC family response regulator
LDTYETVSIGFQPTPREIVVLVGDNGEEIRSALATRLEDEGYVVIEADNLAEARAFIGAAATPMLTVVGSNAGWETASA